MKNLLYTLLIGLVVISCNKDEEYGSAPLALEVEHTIDAITIDQAYAFINSLSGKEGSEQAPSTARNENNKITVAFIATDNDNFAHLVSEDISIEFCYDNYTVELFEYSYDSPSLFVYDLDTNEESTFTLSAGLLARYDAVFGQSLNNMQYIDYVGVNPTARLGAQPSRTGDNTFSAN